MDYFAERALPTVCNSMQNRNESYVGMDPHWFAPKQTASSTTPLRPFLCNGQTNIRATWRLLGYLYPQNVF